MNEYLKYRSGTLVTLMGDGVARVVHCGSNGRRTRSKRSSREGNRRRNKVWNKRNRENRKNIYNVDFNNDYYNDPAGDTDTSGCDGGLQNARLIAPVALASGKDGSVYIGDYNYIRMVSPSWDRVTNILKLKWVERI